MYQRILREKLITFLASQGLTAQFIANINQFGRQGIKSIEDLAFFMYKTGIPMRQAVFWAFYWTGAPETKRNIRFWPTIAFRWRRFLKGN